MPFVMITGRSSIIPVALAIAGLCVGFGIERLSAPPPAPIGARPKNSPPERPLPPPANVPLPGAASEESSALIPYALARKMRLEGNYVLDSETVERRAQLEERAYRTAEVTMDKRAADYRTLFSSLHIDPEVQAQLLEHLQKIYRAKAQVANAMSVLQKARESYDERVEQVLGDKYDRYLEHEAAYLPSVELAELTKLAKAKNQALPAGEEAVVRALIQEDNVLTMHSFADLGGPYGEVRPPSSGGDFQRAMSAESERLKQQYGNLLKKAEQKGLSGATLQAIRDYYENELSRYDAMAAQSPATPNRG
jgi:hypothetical protein